jgi:hypothetical protein
MIFGKPVIVVRPPNSIAKVADHSSGAALLAESKEDVIKSIKMFLYDTAAKARINNFAEEFVKKYAYTQDGKASARAAELIESMACGQMMCSPTGSLENEPINHLGVAV